MVFYKIRLSRKKASNKAPSGVPVYKPITSYQQVFLGCPNTPPSQPYLINECFNTAIYYIPLSKMDIMHKVLNILLPLISLSALIFILPPFLVYKFLRSVWRSIFCENVAGKVILITGSSSGIGEVCDFSTQNL